MHQTTMPCFPQPLHRLRQGPFSLQWVLLPWALMYVKPRSTLLDWLISLGTISSRFISAVACINTSYVSVRMYQYVRRVSYFASCCDKHYHHTTTTTNSERKIYFSLKLQCQNPTFREVRADPQSQKPIHRTKAETMKEHYSLACSSSFLHSR